MSLPEPEPPRASASAAALVCRDIILLIFEHLSVSDLACASCVWRAWNSVSRLAVKYSVQICRHCGGGDWIVESGVKCTSLACPVFYERRKVQMELRLPQKEVSTQSVWWSVFKYQVYPRK